MHHMLALADEEIKRWGIHACTCSEVKASSIATSMKVQTRGKAHLTQPPTQQTVPLELPLERFSPRPDQA